MIIEHQEIINLLDNQTTQPSKFRIKKWVEINDDSRRTYSTNSQIKFKTPMLKSNLCDYVITINGAGEDSAARQVDERNKGVIFKNCAPFTDCISEINNTQAGKANNLDVVLPMYNLIEYSDNYLKISRRSLWEYYRDELHVAIVNSELCKSKIKITGKSLPNGNSKTIEVAVPLNYLSNFWGTL